MRRAIARILVFSLPFVVLLQLVGQPDLDDWQPLLGTRSVSAKVFKQELSVKSSLTHTQHFALAVGSQPFTPGFYLIFVRIARQLDFVRAPLASLRSSRSPPPRIAAV